MENWYQKNINDVKKELATDIEKGLSSKQVEEKQTVVEEVLGREEAEKIIEKAIKNYKEKFEN